LAVTARGILFSGPLVRSILDGRKTVTRRVVRIPEREGCVRTGNEWSDPGLGDGGYLHVEYRDDADAYVERVRAPWAVGSRLWVRETWRQAVSLTPTKLRVGERIVYRADDGVPQGVWRPSIFMPRWASRIDLEVTGVRVERLQEITEEDARAEGVTRSDGAHPESARNAYARLWDAINGKRAPWASDPMVWRVEFRRVES
jgi:hypothetical protein